MKSAPFCYIYGAKLVHSDGFCIILDGISNISVLVFFLTHISSAENAEEIRLCRKQS